MSLLKIDPMCYSAGNPARSCRNFSLESAKVGFPCAIQPKGPIKNACPDFELQASTIHRLALDCLNKFPDSIHVGYVQSNSPSIPWMDSSNVPHVIHLTDELGVSGFFDLSEFSGLSRNASEYSTVTEIRRAIASLPQAQLTGVDRGSADGSYTHISTVQRSSMHFSASIRPELEPGSVELTDRLGNTGVFMYSDLQKLERENPGDYHTIADLRSAMTPRPIVGYTSIPLRDRLGISSSNDIELNDLNAIPSEHPHITTHRIDARNLPNGSYDMVCRQPTYSPKDFPNASAMTGILIHADEPFEPSEEVKALFEQPKTWRDRLGLPKIGQIFWDRLFDATCRAGGSASLRRALQQIKAGERVPLPEIWAELDDNRDEAVTNP